MGLSIFAALLVLAYSLWVQSPSRQVGYQVEPYLRDSRVRMATTVAFALLLLTVGFYVAGVPLGNGATQAQVPVETSAETVPAALTVADLSATNEAEAEDAVENDNTASGAFAAPLPQSESDEQGGASEIAAAAIDAAAPADDESPVDPAEDATETPIPTPSSTPTVTPTPTPTPTPLPTATPTPTLTPTPIFGDTAQVATGGSTLWVKRTPGGQNLVILRDGDTVILLPGSANQAGLLWQEVRTVEGVGGWVQSEFLAMDSAETDEQ